MTAELSTIEFTTDSGVATITLNRPDKLNSFTSQMHTELRQVIALINSDKSIRCLVITGTGRGFCAGQDLADLDMNALADTVGEEYNPLVRNLTALPIPVIASVNGVAAGAGTNMALACDIVLAAESAKFIQPFANIGLIPDAGGTWSLPRLIGLPRALALAMTCEPVDARQAADWGMIWKCVPDTDLAAETSALANRLANLPTTSLAYIKRLMRDGTNNSLDKQLDLERDYQAAASQTADFQEGVDAFLNKRAPKFTGS
ncbi:MAG: 2-(1,2-epoxy-1,2-dihydrophenyl)acetyl-CoA isomerase PaaG [Gammaproteobacteria bacterium]|nr:2-(1,2-epoxy-1,2-dihydrophenyl)acetyl-CoA isomerase PaaG [Gammaproteobacteria bacterium]